MRLRESDGRSFRQSGQVLTEAATTNLLRVVRLLHFPIALFSHPAAAAATCQDSHA